MWALLLSLALLGAGAILASLATIVHRVLRSTKDQEDDLVLIERLEPEAVLPYRHLDAAGYDLHSLGPVTVPPHGQACVRTGWAMRAPPGCYLRIAERSGLALRGVGIGGGVVDRDYTGEVQVLLRNFADAPLAVESGERIAQVIVTRKIDAPLSQVLQLPRTEGGNRELGSSDKRT